MVMGAYVLTVVPQCLWGLLGITYNKHSEIYEIVWTCICRPFMGLVGVTNTLVYVILTRRTRRLFWAPSPARRPQDTDACASLAVGFGSTHVVDVTPLEAEARMTSA